MVTLLIALLLFGLPAVSLAQGDGPDPRGFNNAADAFIFRADVCAGNSPGCGTTSGAPSNVIASGNGGVRGFVNFRVPATQPYTVFLLAADIDGALGPSSIASQATGILTAGGTASVTAPFPTLASGVYRFIVVVLGANGRATISQPYQFRYCNVACVAE